MTRYLLVAVLCLFFALPLSAQSIFTDASLGNTDKVAASLAADPTLVNAVNDDGDTPLIEAAQFCRLATVKVLLDHGADLNARNKQGITPLLAMQSLQINDQSSPQLQKMVAQQRADRLTLLKLLLAKGADANARDEKGWTALHHAVVNHRIKYNPMLDVVTVLLTKIDVNAQDKEGKTPLHYAASYNNLASAQLLLANGAQVNAQGNDGGTPLHDAVSMMVNIDGNTGKVTVEPRTPMITLLVSKGADVNAKDKAGCTPIFNAETREVLDTLLAKGAKLDVKANDGATALHYAARAAGKDNGVVVQFLLQKGLDANAKTDKGRTPLFFAVQVNMGKDFSPLLNPAIALLLAKGASLQAVDAEGNSLLHAAAGSPFFAAGGCIAYLLKNKLSPTAKNAAGLTPADIAKTAGWESGEINFLLGKGPDPMANKSPE